MKRALGVCYYPEHWAEDHWADDARRMAEAGLSWVRVGEFAWSLLEPAPGEFDFDWMDRAIDILAQAGLKIVLGTPTATPPRWMLDKYPDMLAIDTDGHPRKFGSRRHYCFSHQGYLDECRRIARVLGERYGGDDRIAAWQIDNEYGCHDTTLSYSQSAQTGFRDWLAQRYQSPEALNAAWGNAFWSMQYRDFDEIDLPNQTVTEPNPAHEMAFRRYSSEQVARFNAVQAKELRTWTNAPLLHNYMGRVLDFDHYVVGANLDIASWDSYPLGFLMDRIECDDATRAAFLRQGHPDFQAFHHDLYRTVGRGRWWVMEQQPGPVNWAPWNPAPLPGMVRLWSWEAFAHGAEVVSYFRWRQVPFAQEQMHTGLLRTDASDAQALVETTQVARELAEMPEAGTASAKVAIVFDYASQWAWEVQPQGADFNYFNLVFSAYRALRRQGVPIDILSPETTDLSDYALVLIPGLMLLPEALQVAIEAAEARVVLGPRFNCRSAEFRIPDQLPPATDLVDAKVTLTESLPPSASIAAKGGGAIIRWWEHIESVATRHVEAVDGQLILSGDRIQYLAGWPDDALWNLLVTDWLADANIDALKLPDSLRVR
ncbi:MAG: beta-galactosidase, partial [Dinoroseobacter sp.]|nr:beta-galactosidase [Dinoroseobacter sp.]